MAFPQADPSITLMDRDSSQRNNGHGPKTHIIPAAHGHAFTVKKGERFRVVDLYGEQVVDFAAWVQGTGLIEKLSMAYTRYAPDEHPHQAHTQADRA